jgi:hypothetical protein
MVGGFIVQKAGDAVEVVDTGPFDRCWRKLERPDEVREGDSLWWQSFTGYLTRHEGGAVVFRDKDIGRCEPCNPHGREPRA